MNIIFQNILLAIIALAITPFMQALIKRYAKEEPIFNKEFFKDIKFNKIIALITPILIIALLYKHGISNTFFIYSFISIILVILTFVDIKAQIIPNELNFIGFLVGIVIAYIVAVKDMLLSFDLLLGMITGAGIFILIALFALVVYRKEGMGIGDIKLMGMLGLFLGVYNIIQVFIISFLVGAIISIFLLVAKIKKSTDYIPFGPFIVIATIFTMFVPATQTIEYITTFLR